MSESYVNGNRCADNVGCYLLLRTSISASGGSLEEDRCSLLRFHCASSMVRSSFEDCRDIHVEPNDVSIGIVLVEILVACRV